MSIISPAVASLDAALEMAAGGQARCTGNWTTLGLSAALEQHLARIAWPSGPIVIDGTAMTAFDTAGAWLLRGLRQRLAGEGFQVTLTGLRPEYEALLQRVEAVAEAMSPPTPLPAAGWLAGIGRRTWQGVLLPTAGIVAFLGECALALLRVMAHPSRLRWRTVLYNMQTAGFNALPITGLLAFLMGIVIAYQGAEQLRRYGANIFVADLVGLSMLRELSPLLTAIIVAGRSGSAYAAQIGTMKVTEEIDALRTIGVAPLELLVLPKILALILALPLLTVFADLMGVAGGMLMAAAKLEVGFSAFIDRLREAISFSSYLIGIGKAPVFAAIIALVGCYQGFQVTGSAESVGRQTTISVVQGIFLVIVADALFSIIFSWLNI